MKISTKSRYALQALLYMDLYSHEKPISIKNIAAATKISEKYLEQIFIGLRKAGILKTVRGAKGGFLLNIPSDDITVGHILRIFETSTVPVSCVGDLSQCKSQMRGNCVTRQLWIQISQGIEEVVEGITLASLKKKYEVQEGNT